MENPRSVAKAKAAYSAGPQAAAAILKHAPTLENVRLDGATALSGEFLHQLLCSAPNLKRFDAIAQNRFWPNPGWEAELDAFHIASSSSDWACLSLESFKCRIKNIVRPDVKRRTNGRPFDHNDPLHSGSMEESRVLQRSVYRQLGRLTKLKTLILGLDNITYTQRIVRYEIAAEGKYYSYGVPIQAGYQYECLDMTVQSGVDLMAGLKELRHVKLDAMAIGVDPTSVTETTPSDLVWMKAQWPKLGLEYEDTFWPDLELDE